jgi:hypothetical protein
MINRSEKLVVVVLLILLLVAVPIAAIESFNVLFPYNQIVLDFKTWLSAFVLITIFAPTRGK